MMLEKNYKKTKSNKKFNTLSLNFANESLSLDSTGAIYWDSELTLIISDLHFEKASYLANFGSPIPQYDTFETLTIISDLIESYKPKRLICLGDSFHDSKFLERIENRDVVFLQNLIDKVPEWIWILGNHDPEIPDQIKGIRESSYKINNITFLHEPESNYEKQIVGHFHPKFSKRVSGISLKGKCFVNNDDILIMPSMGSFTGGLDVKNKVIKSLFNNDEKYHLLYNNKIWSV